MLYKLIYFNRKCLYFFRKTLKKLTEMMIFCLYGLLFIKHNTFESILFGCIKIKSFVNFLNKL